MRLADSDHPAYNKVLHLPNNTLNMEKKKILMFLPTLFPAIAGAQGHYNIVYIMTDDHTAQMMSCYDKRYISTPNLDRIAADGVRFVNSYVANSLSGPSRACMLTGKHSHKNGFTNNEHGIFDGSQQTMPKLLQKAGYQTALIGKWHLVSTPTGFDYYDYLPAQGNYYNPDFINMKGETYQEKGYLTNIITDKAIDWLENKRDKNKPFLLLIHHKACHRNWLPELKYLHEYEDQTFPIPSTFYDNYEGRVAAGAQEMEIGNHMDIIYDTKMYRPGLNTPLTENYLNMVGRMDSKERAEYDHFYDSISTDFWQRHLEGKQLAEFKYQRYMRDYAKVVKTLDDNVGRTLDYLRDAGLMDSTLVVYTSDQGFYMGEHGWFDKRFMYEESLRTPLIIAYPGHIKPGSTCNRLVQNIDYAPTFLELAGVKKPNNMPGRSLTPVFESGDNVKKWRTSIYYHYYDYPTYHMVRKHDGVRTERYKLIHFYGAGGLDAVKENKYQRQPGTREYGGMKYLNSLGYFEPKDSAVNYNELYDLSSDPHELNNLYGKPGYEKITKQLQRELDNYRKSLEIDEY